MNHIQIHGFLLLKLPRILYALFAYIRVPLYLGHQSLNIQFSAIFDYSAKLSKFKTSLKFSPSSAIAISGVTMTSDSSATYHYVGYCFRIHLYQQYIYQTSPGKSNNLHLIHLLHLLLKFRVVLDFVLYCKLVRPQ